MTLPGKLDSRSVDPARPVGDEVLVGDRFEVEVGAVAHGGHCVARAPDGRVVFVRHALPGERVTVSVTEVLPGYLRADAVEILSASPDRVEPPCPYATPAKAPHVGRHTPVAHCGGCDFQHVAPAAQRELKAAVVREQLLRLGGLSPAEVDALGVRVEELPGGPLGWRTRVRYTVDASGRAGLLAHRSNEVVPVDRCLIAHPAVQDAPVTGQPWPTDDRVEAIAGSGGDVTLVGSTSGVVSGPAEVTERAVGRRWRLGVQAFWQVHPAAPDTLVSAVLDLVQPVAGERAWDLYGGAGLFAAALAPRVAEVTLVESDREAITAARSSLADLSNVHIVRSTVERFRPAGDPDVVVLDPPRTGAGAAAVRLVAGASPRAVAYVACDPAAFARDVATFRARGFRLAALRAFDAFPMTHHVECVGLLLPA
ncbi:class I SAM-dependent RNA methyltransferase [Rugosimonospora africana]|uniref:23S rRNA methyltransferase n=1 Tax=Rugosimonospora africana TaxID=556532 RepID=A0A8J3QRF1_9ACTN|nr:TRAM domain-containing protein [Rugosimonospora africana]GIH13791.1 23S rRNA methyltransferase [Rugosimonospora africana]